MPSGPLKTFSLIFLLAVTGFSRAQTTIPVSDSLAARADMWKVKLGSQGIGKLWKLHFGDYGVLTSKRGWQTDKVKGNLLDTKIESKSTIKFSFTLSDKNGDTAWVNAANNIVVKALQEITLFSHFSWGSNEIIRESKNFTAFITINQDTIETWALFINENRNSEMDNQTDAFLTNGTRKIILIPVHSKKTNNVFSIPASGFEYFENGGSLCALQYAEGMGMNNSIVWLDKNPDAKMKLILSAAMTAVLELKLSEMGNQEQ